MSPSTCCARNVWEELSSRLSLFYKTKHDCRQKRRTMGVCGFGGRNRLTRNKHGECLEKPTALIAVLDRRFGTPNAARDVVSAPLVIPVEAARENDGRETPSEFTET